MDAHGTKMTNNKRLCVDCNIPMKKTFVKYKGLGLEARQCPKCKEKIFTEDLTMKAISKLEAKRLEHEYLKRPIKIGHSWGITFPKEITEVFELGNPKTTLKLHPNLEKGKIEIKI
jgi:hypothetical protein